MNYMAADLGLYFSGRTLEIKLIWKWKLIHHGSDMNGLAASGQEQTVIDVGERPEYKPVTSHHRNIAAQKWRLL